MNCTAVPVLALAGVLAACSCAEDAPGAAAPATSVGGEALPYLFTDITAESGLAAFTQVNGTPDKEFVVESFGAGTALFDPDGDGDLDVYLSNGGRLEGLAEGEEPRDALFWNDGRARFTDGTSAAGLGDPHWTNGVRTVDLDSDGDVEMYLSNYGPNVLYDNVGGGKFVDVSARSGLDDREWSSGAAFLDFDKDGDLDLYVGEYLEFDEESMLRERPRATMHGHSQEVAGGKRLEDIPVMKGPMGLEPSPDRFFRNEGAGRFVDASQEVGIDGVRRFSFQVLTFDADQDGWLDVFVVNDVLEDLLWRNDGGRRFAEISLQSGVAVREDGRPQGGMGGALGDYDGDLKVDLFVTNFVEDYSTLFRGLEGGFFRDVTSKMGLRKDTWLMVGWGCGFVDFDSDGDLELFEINGHTYPQVDQVELGTSYRQANQLWELRDGRFVVPAGGGGPDFVVPRAGRTSALGDVDGDGDPDLLVGNLDEPPTLLRNDSPAGRWLLVHLIGAPTKGNGGRDAIGARLVLRVGERQHLRLIGTNSGFLSSNDPREHFGLGAATQADELVVTWADGRVERFAELAAGLLHTIEDGGGERPSRLSSTALP
ncbi:MAG TPA: CRTAC1 family protein [Planctomycetota bacterium]